MRIAVVGVGGVGGYFGARLIEAGYDVALIARGEHLEAIQEHGLKLHSTHGNAMTEPWIATSNPKDVGPVDVVIFATKAWQLTEAAELAKPMVRHDTTILPLLNGIEARVILGEVFDSNQILAGFCWIMSKIESAGVISQYGREPHVAFGEIDNRWGIRVQTLREMFESAKVKVAETPNIQTATWQKFIFIASFGSVGAMTQMPIGVLRSIPETHQLLVDAMTEIVRVGRANKILLRHDEVEQAMATIYSLPEESTASMQRDIMAGRPSELDAQTGAIVRLGAKLGIHTPVHQTIYASLLPSELKARGKN